MTKTKDSKREQTNTLTDNPKKMGLIERIVYWAQMARINKTKGNGRI